jgi:hypothetical protein
MNFESTLANIPGLGGYLAKGRYDQQSQSAELGQMGALSQLLGHMEQQKVAQEERANTVKLRSLLSQATPEQLADPKWMRAAAIQFGDPKSILTASKPEFGTTPHAVTLPDGRSVMMVSDKDGNPKILPGMTPQNQFTQGTVDAGASRAQSDRHFSGVSGNTQATLGQRNYEFNNLGANQQLHGGIDLAKLRNANTELQYNTGQPGAAVPEMPQRFTPPSAANITGLPQRSSMAIPPQVQATRDADRVRILQEEAARNPADAALQAELRNAQSGQNYTGLGSGRAPVAATASPVVANPAAPVAAPSGSQLPGKMAAQNAQKIEMEREEKRIGAIDALKTAGYDPATGKDKMSELIKKSTSGMGQNIGAGTAAFFNITTDGRKALNTIKADSSKIVMDMMGGKLGAGISNADRDFVEAQLGSVGDANKTADERLAAWESAKKRLIDVAGSKRFGEVTGLISSNSGISGVPQPTSDIDNRLKRYGNAR